MIEEKLSAGGFDAVTLIHNETSTGTMNPLKEIAAVVKKFPDVLLIVDCVSSFTAMKIPFDELGLDVMLAGHAEGAGAAGGRGGLYRLGEGLREGGDDQGPRLLLRFPRVQEEPGKRHDADDAEHLPFLRAAKQAGGHVRARGSTPATRGTWRTRASRASGPISAGSSSSRKRATSRSRSPAARTRRTSTCRSSTACSRRSIPA